MLIKDYSIDEFKTIPTLMLLVGIPWSWKSTWIKQNNLLDYYISTDELRLKLAWIIEVEDNNGNKRRVISSEKNTEVFKELEVLLIERLKKGKSTIIDATNLSHKNISYYKQIAKQYKFKFILNVFDIPNVEVYQEILWRNKQREDFRIVDEKVIKKFYSFYMNIENENFYWENYFKTPIVPHKQFPNDWLTKLIHYPFISKKDLEDWIYSLNFSEEAFTSKHWNELTNKARGLFMYPDWEVFARSYEKFFNLWELKPMNEELKEYQAPFVLYKKENGFLWIVAYNKLNDKIEYLSKSNMRWTFPDYVRKSLGDFEDKIYELLTWKLKWYSLIFEIINQEEDPHIIPYENKQEAILLDCIKNDMKHFSKKSYEELEEIYKCLKQEQDKSKTVLWLKERKTNVSLEEFNTVLKDTFNIDFEWYVVEDNNGNLFKLKGFKYSLVKSFRPFVISIKKRYLENLLISKEEIDEKIQQSFNKMFAIWLFNNILNKTDKQSISDKLSNILFDTFKIFTENWNKEKVEKFNLLEISKSIKNISLL